MNKTVLTFLLWALFASVSSLRAADCATMAGGVPVVVPPPHQEFVEVGGDKRNFFEVAVPSRNRLLCAFVPTDFLPRLKNPSSGLGKYTALCFKCLTPMRSLWSTLFRPEESRREQSAPVLF